MKWRIGGPLLFATVLFVIEVTLKGIAFKQDTVFFELGPSLALWATGVLFSLAVSEQTKFRGKVEYRAQPKPGGQGFELDYQVRLPRELDFSPKYLYLFVLVLALWIIALVLAEDVSQQYANLDKYTSGVVWQTAGALFLGGISVSTAVSALAEVGE